MKKITDLQEGNTVLVSVPSDQTIQRLQQILSGSPIEIKWDMICMQVAESNQSKSWKPDDGASYDVFFKDFGIRYDPETGQSFLVGFMGGTALDARSKALGMGADYLPCIMFNDGAQLGRTNKSFITSVATTLVTREDKPFTFGAETLLTG